MISSDMPSCLSSYKAKRRFAQTPEPQGGAASADDPIFVIQKHHARRMHYDLRLEMSGTLKSWAVPEGPCLDPKVRRFAKLVEDHPLDYASFEGRIPAGNYGAGTTMYWVDPERDLTFVALTAGVVEHNANTARFQRWADMIVAAL